MFPDSLLVDEKILTEDRGIYASGAYSYLNLLLFNIEKYADRAIAIMTANRSRQSRTRSRSISRKKS